MNHSRQTHATFGTAIPTEQFNHLATVLRWTAELEDEIERKGATSERLEGLRVGQRESGNLLGSLGFDGSQRRLLICNRPVQVKPSRVVGR
jgi:hypothetical protein